MTLHERIQLDLSRGDIGSARARLISAFVSTPYNPALAEEIARLCVQMHDPIEAGRWYFCSESQDEHAASLIERFTSKHSSDLRQVLSQLPLKVRDAPADTLPPMVKDRMAGLRQSFPEPLRKASNDSGNWSYLYSFGCLIAILLFVGTAIVGLRTIGSWIFNRT
jgi:hypothetical protein